jgi:putative transposase
MAVNAAVALARSYYGQRKSQHFRKVSFPKVNGSQGIGLGVQAYVVVRDGDRFVLRVSTGKQGRYVWLPLVVPARYADRVASSRGDARLFRRGNDWYAALPVRVSPPPTGCSGEVRAGLNPAPTFIGVDLGIVRHAVVVAPGRVVFFDGKAARFRREHGAALRRRYQRHCRTDRVKEQRGKERRWMRDLNHKTSRQIVDLAASYPHPVIVLERLEGIRYRAKGGKRFNRMMSSWAFRELVDMIRYKAERAGIPVVLADPRNTSKACPVCGHAKRANRPEQGRFACVRCGYQGNADYVAARNIAAAGPAALAHGRPDTARPETSGQAGGGGPRLDGVQVCASAHTDPNLVSPMFGTPAL